MESEGPEEEEEDEDELEPQEQEPDELIELLEELRRVLDDVLSDEHRAMSEFVPAYMYPRFRDAWDDVSKRFGDVIEEIRSGKHEAGLENHGLRGRNFRLKADGFWRSARAWWANPSRFWLKKALGWGNVVLKSVAVVVPAAGLAEEFKQALERALDDKDEGETELARHGDQPTPG